MAKNGVLTVLSADPGAKNFAISVNKHKMNGSGILETKVVDTCIIDCSIQKVSQNIGKDAHMFISEFGALCEHHGPFDAFIAERFMSRGRIAGTTIEVVGFMLGMSVNYVQKYMPDCHIQLISAALWKNAYNKAHKDKSALSMAYKLCATTPHEMDATFIGLFCASNLLNVKPFSSVDKEQTRDKLLMRIENASRSKLRNTRFRRNYYYE